MMNIDFQDFIIKTVTDDLIKKYKLGNHISLRIQEEWKLRKLEKKIYSEDDRLIVNLFLDFVWPELSLLENPPSDRAFIKTMNASLFRLKNDYSEYLKLISSLYTLTFEHRAKLDYPINWMKDDRQIVENMNKKKNMYFYALFNFITQSRTGKNSSKFHASLNTTGKYIIKKKAYDYILYRPEPNYTDLQGHSALASLSKSKMYLYFRECVRQKIFIDKFNGKVIKDKKFRTKIYAVGYYSFFPGKGFRRNYFLSKKRHQISLRTFDAEFYKKNLLNK